MATQKTALIACVALAALALGPVLIGFVGQDRPPCGVSRHKIQTDDPLILTSPDHARFSIAPKDTPRLIYFGFTACPDICPIDVPRNVGATDILKNAGLAIEPIFVSIDPDRDTPAVLADYANDHAGGLIAVAGTKSETRTLVQAFAAYAQSAGHAAGSTMVNHSGLSYLWRPGAQVVEIFGNDLSSEQMAAQMACVMETG